MPACDGSLFTRLRRGDVFIETGTYAGEGIQAAIIAGFQEIVSVELDPGIASRAKAKFARTRPPIITCLHGDSRQLLPELVERFADRDPMFWLDAHHSGPGTADPGAGVLEVTAAELDAIKGALGDRPATILIDDVWLHQFPKVAELILARWPQAEITHEDGCGGAGGGFHPMPKTIIAARIM